MESLQGRPQVVELLSARSQSRYTLQAPPAAPPKLAFWINAYNAVTIEGILQEYPTTSIRNHTARVFGYNIWQDLPLIVADKQYSLEQIEHEVLRKMNEPKIHFAIVCASIGCPRLRNEAYTSSRVDEQLADNARDFFSRRKNLQVDMARRTLKLSSILSWFDDDFGSTQAKQLQTIKSYLPKDAQSLIGAGNVLGQLSRLRLVPSMIKPVIDPHGSVGCSWSSARYDAVSTTALISRGDHSCLNVPRPGPGLSPSNRHRAS